MKTELALATSSLLSLHLKTFIVVIFVVVVVVVLIVDVKFVNVLTFDNLFQNGMKHALGPTCLIIYTSINANVHVDLQTLKHRGVFVNDSYRTYMPKKTQQWTVTIVPIYFVSVLSLLLSPSTVLWPSVDGLH